MIHTNAVGHKHYHHIVYLKYMRPCSMRAARYIEKKEVKMREGEVTSACAATACYPWWCEDGQLQ